MLQVSVIREELEAVKKDLAKRNLSADQMSLLEKAISLDDKRKVLQREMDESLSAVNKMSKEIGKLYSTGQHSVANEMKAKVSAHKSKGKELELAYKETENQLEEALFGLPNRPHSSVPNGSSEDDNEVVKDWTAAMPDLHDKALPHWEIGEKYNLFDLKLGVRITGAGFPLYRGKGARLQRALINFFIDVVRGDILKSTDFPLKYCGHTPCFRREAGSYGADVKGLNRVHQFDKVEIVQIQHPDKSYETLDQMVGHIETILTKLELPYRILRLCGGDLTFASALTYDFEVYSAAQKRWLEVSSVSNFETFQANRLKTRYKDENGKTQLVHTLNGSALALARIVASMLENHQTPEGIVIPQALRPYTGFDIIN